MQNQVITISRKKYATGLFWQPVISGQNPRAFAANLAKSVDNKLNLFAEYRNMAGVSGRKMGHRARMSAAAANLAESFAEYSSFLAVFAVPQGFWIVALRNGVIIADRLYTTDDDAKREFTRLVVLPDWGALIEPSCWKVSRAIEKILDDVVMGSTSVTLRPISNFRTNVVALAIVGVLAFGLFQLFRGPLVQMVSPQPQIAKINHDVIAEYKRQMEQRNRELDNMFPTTVRSVVPATAQIPMPYDALPDKFARADLCWRAIGFLMQVIPGWVQTSVDCDMDTATAKLRRGYGTLADLYAAIPELMRGAEITELSESEVMLRVNLPILQTSASLEELDAESVMREINSILQLISANGDVRLSMEEVANNDRTAIINTVLAGIQSKLTPQEFIKIFDSLSGIAIPKISWDARTRTWNYEVKIYVK